jgi:uncharacterized protein (TIGR02246 family)
LKTKKKEKMQKKDAASINQDAQKEVEFIVKQLMEGFAGQDAESFSSVFADDADCIIRDGQHLKGRDEIRETHRRIFSSIYSEGTKSSFRIESIRFLQSDVSLVRIKGHMEFSKEGQSSEVNGRISLVCNNVDNKWHVALFQNTSEMTSL